MAEKPPYHRVNVVRLFDESGARHDVAAPPPADTSAGIHVRWFIIGLSVVLCTGQMVIATLAQNLRQAMFTSTLISTAAFGVLMLIVLVLNPLLHAVFRGRFLRPLNRAELTCVFTALLVTAGIGTFGLSSALVPLVATPWNPEWNTVQRGWDEHVLPHLNESLYIAVSEDMAPEQRQANLEVIRQYREGLEPVDARGEVIQRPPENASWREAAEYWWAVLQQIPWWTWIKPLSLWLIFVGACYAMFYSLTYVVLRSWAHREQLIFPLAQLPEQLLPESGSGRWLPPMLRGSAFWIAFLIVFALLSWNAAVNIEWIPGLGRIHLGMDARTINPMLQGTIFEGMTGGRFGLRFLIIFMAVGLAFLLPTHISFSLWFYFLVANGIILSMVWLGHGQSGSDFPSGIYSQNNIITAQGGGALLMFGGVCLGRALADWLRLGRGKPWPERVRMSGPVMGLLASLAVITGWLIWNDLPVLWALGVTTILMLFTMGVMRVVAEGGVYWFQVHTGPFHLYHALGLGAWLKAPAIAPLMPIYAVLFLDIKTFLAPNLANSAKMQVDVNANRRRFHLNIVLCIVISVIVAVGLSLFLSHLIGAQQMRTWFYSSLPQNLMNQARDLTTAPPEFNPPHASAYGLGGAWVLLSMFLRQTVLWFPHPIGYVMFVNPLMTFMWFSFFLGWIAKKFVVKYGGKQTFESARPIFIGMLMGEVMAILLWTLLGLWLDVNPGLTDNRMSA